MYNFHNLICGERLGSGLFSKVYEHKHDPNLVVKITHNPNKKRDGLKDGYLVYALLSKHYPQEFTPKIKELLLYKNLLIVITPKLEKAPFLSDSQRNNYKEKLKKYVTSKGAIQFVITNPIPYDLVRKIIVFRVKEVSKK